MDDRATDNGPVEYSPEWEHGTGEEHEGVEWRLAHYAVVREERDREVRLLFRDTPASDIARAFMAAGATLISIAGERAPDAPAAPVSPSEPLADAAGRHRRRRKPQRAAPVSGEVTLRYFYALGETVYTVAISIPSGVAGSIAGIYPGARLLEQEVQSRLGIVLRGED